MIVRELVTILRLNVDSAKLDAFEKKVEHAKEGLAKFNEVLAAGLAAGAFGEIVTKAAESFENLNRTALGLGMSTGGLSKIKFMSDATGGSFEGMSTALFQMNRALGSAHLQPNGPANQALQRLGINLKDILSMKPEDQFERLAERISEVPNPADRARVAMDLFGRGARGILPMLSRGKEGMAELINAYKKFAPLSTLQQKNLEKLAFAQNVLKISFDKMAAQLASAVAPAFTKVAEAITNLIAWFTRLSPEVKTFVGIVALLATTLPIVVVALGSLRLILPIIQAGLGLINLELWPLYVGMGLLFLVLQDMYVFTQGKNKSLFGTFLGADIKPPQWIHDMKTELQAVLDILVAIVNIITGNHKGLNQLFDIGAKITSATVTDAVALAKQKENEHQTMLNDYKMTKSAIGEIHYHLGGPFKDQWIADDKLQQKVLNILHMHNDSLTASLNALY